MNRHNSRETRRKSLWSLSISGSLPIFHKKTVKSRGKEREKANLTIPLSSSADEKQSTKIYSL
jgi:hypothetical protein